MKPQHYPGIKSFHYYLVLIFIWFASSTIRAQWEPTSGPPNVERTTSLASLVTDSGDTNLYAGTYDGGVFLSTDNGDNWTSLVGENWNSDSGSFTKSSITALLSIRDDGDNINLFAGTEGDGIFLSTNYDTNWVEVNAGIFNKYVYKIITVDTFLFAVAGRAPFPYGLAGSLFRSSNMGLSWEAVDNGLDDTSVTAFAFYKDKSGVFNLFLGTWLGGIYHSSNFGENWIKYDSEINAYYINDLLVMDTILFAATNYQIFRSDDNSKNWEPANEDLTNVERLEVNDTIIFAQKGADIYYSLNGGYQWLSGRSPGHGINCMLVQGIYLFVGIDAPFFIANTVWRRLLSQMTTDVENFTDLIPSQFILYQNYPNPFNPSTNVKWEMGVGGYIKLKIIDLLGREIETLVNQYYPPGNYEIEFDAENLSSGVYFYSIEIEPRGKASSFRETKKFILLR